MREACGPWRASLVAFPPEYAAVNALAALREREDTFEGLLRRSAAARMPSGRNGPETLNVQAAEARENYFRAQVGDEPLLDGELLCCSDRCTRNLTAQNRSR